MKYSNSTDLFKDLVEDYKILAENNNSTEESLHQAKILMNKYGQSIKYFINTSTGTPWIEPDQYHTLAQITAVYCRIAEFTSSAHQSVPYLTGNHCIQEDPWLRYHLYRNLAMAKINHKIPQVHSDGMYILATSLFALYTYIDSEPDVDTIANELELLITNAHIKAYFDAASSIDSYMEDHTLVAYHHILLGMIFHHSNDLARARLQKEKAHTSKIKKVSKLIHILEDRNSL